MYEDLYIKIAKKFGWSIEKSKRKAVRIGEIFQIDEPNSIAFLLDVYLPPNKKIHEDSQARL